MTDQIEGKTRQGLGAVEGLAGGALGDTVMQLRGRAEEALGVAQETYGKAKDTVLDAADKAEAYARDKPMTALAAAAALGLFAGILLTSRRANVIVVRDRH
jgi:uncharacterized protein YjbJ (UPF0337 family)